MGACASRPKALDGEAPVELPAAKETTVATSEVTTAEANATADQAATESSESKAEKEEEPLVDLSEPKPGEAAAERKAEEQTNAAPVTAAGGETKEEAPGTEGAAGKSEEKAEVAEPKQA